MPVVEASHQGGQLKCDEVGEERGGGRKWSSTPSTLRPVRVTKRSKPIDGRYDAGGEDVAICNGSRCTVDEGVGRGEGGAPRWVVDDDAAAPPTFLLPAANNTTERKRPPNSRPLCDESVHPILPSAILRGCTVREREARGAIIVPHVTARLPSHSLPTKSVLCSAVLHTTRGMGDRHWRLWTVDCTPRQYPTPTVSTFQLPQ